eukprot:1138823-Pelagomonas_calceolata.AAC.5
MLLQVSGRAWLCLEHPFKVVWDPLISLPNPNSECHAKQYALHVRSWLYKHAISAGLAPPGFGRTRQAQCASVTLLSVCVMPPACAAPFIWVGKQACVDRSFCLPFLFVLVLNFTIKGTRGLCVQSTCRDLQGASSNIQPCTCDALSEMILDREAGTAVLGITMFCTDPPCAQ